MSKKNKRWKNQFPYANNQSMHNQLVAQKKSISFSGPIPHPDILKGYNDIVPGAAERILCMAEEQSKHRREIENKVISSGINNSKRGLILAFILGLAGVSSTILISIFGNPYIAGFMGFSTFISLTGTFIYGTHSRKKERDERRQEAQRVT